jgi:hypothetical protein
MRLFHVLPVLGLLPGARASSFGSREPASHRLDMRDTSVTDVCAPINILTNIAAATGNTELELIYFVARNSGSTFLNLGRVFLCF